MKPEKLLKTFLTNLKRMLFLTHLNVMVIQLMAMRMLQMPLAIISQVLALSWLQKFLQVIETSTHTFHVHLKVHLTCSILIKLKTYLFAVT